ncbi:carboxypeptidase-like regulatory domain-containing protein [Flavobacterium silvaticum]|uniref:TonB-dependent receptor plug domain-containing protein n=1 Tax=Flavobacterium silvaticum TaxID=1852020 RepID=A0A972FTK4_9FLAO|nr:carboxypeptidase-like regulatory domain-containing protein [Flavobacterium silvaticum]NMH28223.1 TonB-dependent receptor plug domain-containing protein [Flavobacterium silvaticum]
MKFYILLIALCTGTLAFAQSTLKGTVTDKDNLPLPGANVKVVGTTTATSSDSDGKFILPVTQNPPFTIEISSVGFTTQTMRVTSLSDVTVKMASEDTKLDEIVISASRTPERVLESPVTIERMTLQQIKNTTSPTFYDGLENMKEVHFNTSSLSFKSINTRGFSTVANTRFLQLVDGMDNSSPALNFVLGNLVGLSEVDVANVELLPGASSALYGANAFNGILFMNSKSPFTNEGISTYFKYGKTSQDAAGTNDYYDFGIRMAKAFTPHFAAKANFSWLRATEWIANETSSVTGGTSHADNPNYDGLNTYGDEVTTFLPNVGQVSRTGYREQDVNENKIESVKADISIHIKPMADDLEIIFQEKVGLGSTIYQGANRYSLKNFLMNQVRLEVRNRNFFVRGYMTSESAGDSYDMRFAAWNVNRAWKTDTQWFTDYATAFALSQANFGYLPPQAHAYARQFADYNDSPGIPLNPSGASRYMPGTPEFDQALASVTANPDLTQGAKFKDNSKLYHVDANYNFKELIKFAEIQLGGSFRQYALNSDGTIFTDYDGIIRYNEYGAYTQVQKKFLKDERLKFTGSVRYDKSELFDGFFSPRVALVYSAGANKVHNFRASFQTGFRNPTTQDLFIGLDLGPFALIGSAAENLNRFVETQPVSAAGQQLPGVTPTVTLDGNDAYNNSYTLASVQAFAQSQNPADLQVANIKLVKPERVKAFEIGYRAVLESGLSVDINAYYNIYNDFLNQSRVITPYYGHVNDGTASQDQVNLGYQALAFGDRRVYQIYTNSQTEVESYGVGIGLSKKIYKNFELGANYNYAGFEYDASEDPSFIPGFNTPKHRVKAMFGNPNAIANFGFNLNVRWNTEYLWQSSFGDGMVPENTVFDAQVSYNIPVIKSVVKVGGANLFGKDYIQVIGAGRVGEMVYVSFTYNP